MKDEAKKQLDRMMKYCTSQDRSIWQVRQKLEKEILSEEEINEIIDNLVDHDFLNDGRFAESFVRGKFRMKKWGRFKIVFHLLHHDIPQSIINEAIATIDEDEYLSAFQFWLNQKLAKTSDKAKIYAFLTSKGYENFYILQNWNLDK